MAKNVFSKKQIGSSRHSSTAMDRLMKTGKIGKILSDHREQDAFHSELKKYSSGGVTKDELRKTLGALAKNTRDSITKGEVSEIGRELKGVLGSKRMIMPEKEKAAPPSIDPKNNPTKTPEMKPNIETRLSFKSNSAFSSSPTPKEQNGDAISLPRAKSPSGRTSELLSDILGKKTT